MSEYLGAVLCTISFSAVNGQFRLLSIFHDDISYSIIITKCF